MIYSIQNETLCALVSDTGAELISVKKSEREYIWQADASYWSSYSPLLFPICGRLLSGEYSYNGKVYQMIPHGFAKKSDFKLIEKTEDKITMLLSSNEQTREIYPFDFDLRATFFLVGDELNVEFLIQNKGEECMPYMLGWHPGFNLCENGEINEHSIDFGGKTELSWRPLQNGCFVSPNQKRYILTSGKYFLCEEEIYKNDTMIFANAGRKVDLLSPLGDKIISLEYSENLPYLCIWKTPRSEAKYICIEPWSDLPSDGETPENFDTRKMSHLTPGASQNYFYKVKFN